MNTKLRKEDEEKKKLISDVPANESAPGVVVPKQYSAIDLSKYSSGYQKSDSVINAEKNKANAEKALAGLGDFAYSKQGDLDNILGKILNREEFKYDLNGDALYKQYADKFINQGKMASQDVMGQAAAMTGGYGNSYAAAVGNQAYQQSLQQLNDVVPELYQMAYDRHAQEGQDLYNRYSLLSNDKNTEYGMWGDKRNQLIAERDYAANEANNEYARDYGEFNDAYNRDFSQYWQETQFGYGQDRDAVADSQWQQSFDYGKQRDEVADEQWRESFDYGKSRDEIADAQWRESFDYGKQRDEAADAQWRESFDYGKSRDEIADAQWRESFEYGKSRDEVADEQWEASFNEGKRQYNASLAEDQRQFNETMTFNKDRDDASDAENAKSYAYGQAMNAIQAGVMPSEDVLKSAGIDEKTAKSMIEAYTSKPAESKLTVDTWNKINEKAAAIVDSERINAPADGGEMELLTYLNGLCSAKIIGEEELLSIMELYFPSAKSGESVTSNTGSKTPTKPNINKILALK